MSGNGVPPKQDADKDLGEIVAEVSEKASLLVREEIELAKAEQTDLAEAGVGVLGAVDHAQRRHDRLSIFPGDEIQAVAQQVHDADSARWWPARPPPPHPAGP